MQEKQLKNLTQTQKYQAYKQAIDSGELEDTFEGFCDMLQCSTYRIYDNGSLKLIECYWGA